MKITKKLAAKVLEVVDAGLCSGKGTPVLGQMCVEAAVTFALGEPFSDEPSCVSEVLRSFKISLNDKNWSNNEARSKGLRRIALAQLGTKDTLDEKEFVRLLTEMTIKKTVPAAIRLVAETAPEPHKTAILEAALECEKNPTETAARNAEKVTRKWANAAAYAAANAAYAAANAAIYAAYAYAAIYAATYAATYAADYAYAAAYDAANAANARDKVLSDYAEDVVQILIKLKTPGSEFLCLTE